MKFPGLNPIINALRTPACFAPAAFAWLSLWMLFAFPVASSANQEPPWRETAEHERTAQLISFVVENFLYRKHLIDDTVSLHTLRNFIEFLDPNRMLFLQSDIDAFHKHADALDDHLENADFHVFFEIHAVYRLRVKERIAHGETLPEEKFDFSRAEMFQFDRSEARWAQSRAELDAYWRQIAKHYALGFQLEGSSQDEYLEYLRNEYLAMQTKLEAMDVDSVFELAMNAILRAVDPHMVYQYVGEDDKPSLNRTPVEFDLSSVWTSSIEIQSTNDKVLIGVIGVPSLYLDFEARARGLKDYRSATRDIQAAIAQFRAAGAKGIIVDLRANPGGAFAEVASILGLTIRKGPAFQVRSRIGNKQTEKIIKSRRPYKGPLAILVDRDTASAAELLAAAFQDYRRAIIIGERTSGSASLQKAIDLSELDSLVDKTLTNGVLLATIAEAIRISGKPIQLEGLTPDIEFPAVVDYASYAERAYANAAPGEHTSKAKYRASRFRKGVLEEVQEKHQQRISSDEAFQRLLQLEREHAELLERGEISLRESDRQRTNAQDSAALEKLNELLQNATDSAADEQDELAQEMSQTEKAVDLRLDEAARILVDMIEMKGFRR